MSSGSQDLETYFEVGMWSWGWMEPVRQPTLLPVILTDVQLEDCAHFGICIPCAAPGSIELLLAVSGVVHVSSARSCFQSLVWS
eukprot:COSAG01_NODE_4633_length_4853_cov_6.538332_4_plen_84_part_00